MACSGANRCRTRLLPLRNRPIRWARSPESSSEFSVPLLPNTQALRGTRAGARSTTATEFSFSPPGGGYQLYLLSDSEPHRWRRSPSHRHVTMRTAVSDYLSTPRSPSRQRTLERGIGQRSGICSPGSVSSRCWKGKARVFRTFALSLSSAATQARS
jgi:hypothetical protein